MPIEWKPEYSVDIESIDNQHKKFIEVIENLYSAIQKNETDEKIEEIFGNLKDYIKIHFSTEEGYFEKFNYENSEEHKNEHINFKKRIEELMGNKKESRLKISLELIDFLEDWLINHLISQDQKYKKCFKENGLK